MSGAPHTIIRARASVEYFHLDRAAVDVSAVAIPSPRAPFIRGHALSIEPAIMLITNPTPAANASVRVMHVTSTGEFQIAATVIAPLASVAVSVSPIVPGEEVRTDLLSASDPGARIDVSSTWCDADTVRRTTKELSTSFADVVMPGPDEVLVLPLIGGMAAAGPALDIDLRVIDEDGEIHTIGDISVPGGGIQVINFGPTLKPGQRLQARAGAGAGSCIAYIIDRPEY